MENCKIEQPAAWRVRCHTGYDGVEPPKWIYVDGAHGERFVADALAYKPYDPSTREGFEVEALGVIPHGVKTCDEPQGENRG